MRYYILRTYGENNLYSPDKITGYDFKINAFNAEKLLMDSKTEDVCYLLYHIPSKKFVEQGFIDSVDCDNSEKSFHAKYKNRHDINIKYTAYSSPNCGIIPITKKKVDYILNSSKQSY